MLVGVIWLVSIIFFDMTLGPTPVSNCILAALPSISISAYSGGGLFRAHGLVPTVKVSLYDVTVCRFDGLDMHTTLKWFLLLQFEQIFPHAGHSSFFISGCVPQNLHCHSRESVPRFLVSTRCTGSPDDSDGSLPGLEIDCSCALAASNVWHVPIHARSVRSGVCNNRAKVVSSLMPMTMRSLVSESLRLFAVYLHWSIIRRNAAT